MSHHRACVRCAAALLAVSAAGCTSDDLDPPDVLYGETTFVVVLNPDVNDVNQRPVAVPGLTVADVAVASDDGVADRTDLDGIAVLPGVAAGPRRLGFAGGDLDATLTTSLGARELREVAVAAEGTRSEVMDVIVYAFAGQVVEVNSTMSTAAVNDALARSDTIVFFAGGRYTGDLAFAGSDVTLFGEGPEGGRVFLDGNVTVGGSGNRIRGATISGSLDISGSGVSLAFSRVEGPVEISGSDAVLLSNALCGTVDISGSGTRAIGNVGLAPAGGC